MDKKSLGQVADELRKILKDINKLYSIDIAESDKKIWLTTYQYESMVVSRLIDGL